MASTSRLSSRIITFLVPWWAWIVSTGSMPSSYLAHRCPHVDFDGSQLIARLDASFTMTIRQKYHTNTDRVVPGF